MPTKPKFDLRKLMEKAIEVMRQSINEARADKKASPLVGAVLVKPDGTVDTACRGELLSPITLEQMQSFTAPMYNRNPKLQFAFSGTKLLEGRGLGMRTLGEAASKHGLPVPRYAFDGVYLNLTIYRHARPAVEALGPAILNKLSKSERSGWEWLATKGHTKSSECAAALGVDDRTARRHLNEFLKLGLVRKTGAGTTTEYQIK